MAVPIAGKNQVQCPHCGQFVGPASRCAHCGMRIEKRMGLRFLRTMAVVVAVGGLFLLHLYAAHSELPLVEIGDISPVMNFASVRIAGTLESDARKLRSGSVFYVINDGTGTLPVFLNPIPEGRLPRTGTRVVATGSLSIAAGNKVRMRAQSVEAIGVPAEAFVSELKLSDVSAEQVGNRMTVCGRVSKVWKPRPGSKAPHKMVLEDTSGSLDIVHWFVLEREVSVGDELEIRGSVALYKGVVQFKVWEASDIQPLEKKSTDPALMKIVDISPAMEKQTVEVEGVLGVPRSIPGGVAYILTDDSGGIEVIFWDGKVSGEERDDLDEGVRVHISAPVGVYKGKAQLVPQDVGGFQALE